MALLVVGGCSGAAHENATPASTSAIDRTGAGVDPSTSTSAGSITPARIAAFNAVLRRAVDWSALTPGVTAAVVSDQGQWQGAYGVGGRGVKLVPSSVMCIASISKTFTAAEVLHLAAQGKIDLDDPMSRYVTNRLTANGATIRQALQMRSGLRDDAAPAVDKVVEANPNEHLSPQRALDLMPNGIVSAPGKEWHYSNANYVLLGLLVERVTGRGLAAALRADLFGPSRLTHIAVQDSERPPPPLAYPFDRKGPIEDGYLPTRAVGSVSAGAGSIAADALTVARWGYQLYGGQVLPPTLTRAMTTRQSVDTGYNGYGLGAMIFPDYGEPHPAVGHGGNVSLPGPHGGVDGYSTILVTVPDLHVSVAVLTPSADAQLDSIVDGLIAAAVA